MTIIDSSKPVAQTQALGPDPDSISKSSAAGEDVSGIRVVRPLGVVVNGWRILPRAFQRLAGCQLGGIAAIVLVSFVIGKIAIDPGYETLTFAIPSHPPQSTWNAEVDGFANRVARAFGVQHSTAREFSGWILEASERHHFRPELIASLVLTESSFRKSVRSPVGAVGPAQVRPKYWQSFCGTHDLLDPAENIYCGAQVLAYLRDHCGDEECALKAYNIGRYSTRDKAASRYVDKIDRYQSSLEAI